MHRLAVVGALVLGLLGLGRPAAAQWAPAVGPVRASPAPGRASAASAANVLAHSAWARAARPRAWPYVVGGAVLGGLLMAGGIALAIDGTDSLTHPIAYVPAVAGAAVVGGGAGYLVFRIRL